MNNLINLGTITAPYREFNFAVAAGAIYNLRYDHQIIEILENNLPNDITVCFGGSGGFTELQTGIAYKYPEENIVPYVQFKNNGATTAQLKVALASGQIIDNRLVLSGTINVQSNQTDTLYTYPDVFTSESTYLLTLTSGANNVTTFKNNGYKKILIQNTSNNDIRIHNSNGFLVPPLGTFIWEVPEETITIYGTVGSSVYMMGFK